MCNPVYDSNAWRPNLRCSRPRGRRDLEEKELEWKSWKASHVTSGATELKAVMLNDNEDKFMSTNENKLLIRRYIEELISDVPQYSQFFLPLRQMAKEIKLTAIRKFLEPYL